jgi:putative molybdopterin biosynthesis protein
MCSCIDNQSLHLMSEQEQFLDVIDRDEADRRFRAAISLAPLGIEEVALAEALGRVLAADVAARVDVPSFDRSNVDGYAVHAGDTFGATELAPKTVRLDAEPIDAGIAPHLILQTGDAVPIATGGMLPRGADAVVMVEHADVRGGQLVVRRAVSPGTGISFAGSDIAAGETVLRIGTVLTSRETGVLAAIGENHIAVWRQPRVAIISTGNELVAPGESMRPAHVYDSNSRILADAVRELGGVPIPCGIVRDNADELRKSLHAALAESDVVLLSGGTSKGQGDFCYRVVAELTAPGIVAHGVALKPGKPLCLAASDGKPVVILPGFPTSAIFTFHEFVAPVIAQLAGRRQQQQDTLPATMAVKVNSEIGRTEYLLVGLVKTEQGLSAFPMGKGSGSVTTFSRADGFVTIPRHVEIIEVGAAVEVRLIGRDLAVAALVVVGSHCLGLDYLISELSRRGVTAKFLAVGSSGGLAAAKRGECDVAGIHLLDPTTGEYNRPFLSAGLTLVEGYRRLQGIVFRRGDARFEGKSVAEIVETALRDTGCVMVNRNQGSGTRILIDRLLSGGNATGATLQKPAGYFNQPTSHNAVAAAVQQGRADWGVAIESAARGLDLGFIPYQDEHYDFVVPKDRLSRPGVQAFVDLLRAPATRQKLEGLGFRLGALATPR